MTTACAAAALALLGTGTVFAAGSIAEKSSIGAGNAINFAFADAGIDPVSATDVEADFDYEQGQFIYDVELLPITQNMITGSKHPAVQL